MNQVWILGMACGAASMRTGGLLKDMQKKILMVVLLGSWMVAAIIQTLGNSLLQKTGLQLRPWVNSALMAWVGIGFVVLLAVLLISGAKDGEDCDSEQALGMLVVAGFIVVALVFGGLCLGLSSKQESAGTWQGKRVLMVTDGLTGTSYYEYKGSLLMGAYLGNSLDESI